MKMAIQRKINAQLVKAATLGPIGDGVKTLTRDELEDRVADQADRHGVYPPAWPMLVDAAREIGCTFLDPDTVALPLAMRASWATRETLWECPHCGECNAPDKIGEPNGYRLCVGCGRSSDTDDD